MKPIILFLSLLLACSGRNSPPHDTTLVGSWKYIGRESWNDVPLDGGDRYEWWPADPIDNTIFRFYEDGKIEAKSDSNCRGKDHCSGTYTLRESSKEDGRTKSILTFNTEISCCFYFSGENFYSIHRQNNGEITLKIEVNCEGGCSIVFKKI